MIATPTHSMSGEPDEIPARIQASVCLFNKPVPVPRIRTFCMLFYHISYACCFMGIEILKTESCVLKQKQSLGWNNIKDEILCGGVCLSAQPLKRRISKITNHIDKIYIFIYLYQT